MTPSIDPAAESQSTANVEMPPELAGPPPRTLPDSIHQSPLAHSRRSRFWGMMTAAGVCGALAPMPFIKTLALYILPLGYLYWTAGGLFLIALGARFNNGDWKKARRYIRKGEASFARVASIIKTPTVVVEGQPTQYALFAALEVRDPETGARVECTAQSRNFAAESKNDVDTTFRVGDVVPIVWLPGQFPKTVQVFEFLEISPDLTLVRRQAQPKPLWQVVGALALVPFFFFTLFWNIYAYSRYATISALQGLMWPMILGGTLGVGLVFACLLVGRRNRRSLATRNVVALNSGAALEAPLQSNPIGQVFFWGMMFLGGALMCGLTVYCWCLTANALLDRSPAQQRPVVIDEMVQVTHSFLFREYNLEYHFAGEQADHSLLTTPQHLSRFETALGIAIVREGRFGWPWVETIEPVAAPDVQQPDA